MSRHVLLTADEFIKRILTQDVGSRSSYRACYMSWVDGFVTDPRLMMIGLDDHMVHRGDGIFEAVKVVQKKPYLLKEHLDRLQRSADLLFLKLPVEAARIRDLVYETLEIAKLEAAIIRIFVSRGTGSFGTNPYDCQKSQIAIVATEFKAYNSEKYLTGAKIGRSNVLPKASPWAQIKSCNYLPNVMMKKESVDRGFDFTVGFDEEGFLTESSTENIILLDEKGCLLRPRLARILKGCTMTRAMDLARDKKLVSECGEAQISEEMLLKAQEVMMVGTTLDVLPVTEYEGKKIGKGQVGSVAKKLNEILIQDQV